jgi:hypothetical protein
MKIAKLLFIFTLVGGLGTVGTLAWASGETCSVSSPTGILCSVTQVSSSGGITSFATVATGFASAGVAHNFVFSVPGAGTPVNIQVPSGTTEGCVAAASDEGCDATCGCVEDTCSCHSSTDYVYCEWWIQSPSGDWESYGEGSFC